MQGEQGKAALHLHVGPGKLGIGLIAASSVEVGLDLCLVTHEASAIPSPATFTLVKKGEDGENSESWPEMEVSKADTLDALPDYVADLIRDVPELLVTIAATTEGLAARAPFLRELTSARVESTNAVSTIFIPCENDCGKGYPGLKSALEDANVDCRETMVNRLCSDFDVDDSGAVTVKVDELAEWVIEGDCGRHAALAALNHLEHVLFVSDVAPYEVRKRWLINGGHLALAITARASDIPTIDQAAADPARRIWLSRIHEALIEALEGNHPGLPDNKSYAADHVAAWIRHEDEVDRILRRLRRADPLPFFDDLERKLIEPARLLGDLSRFPELTYAFDRLHRVVQRPESYLDYDEFKVFLPTLPTSVDIKACSRYAELLRPVFGAKEADSRAEALGVAYDFHREELKKYES